MLHRRVPFTVFVFFGSVTSQLGSEPRFFNAFSMFFFFVSLHIITQYPMKTAFAKLVFTWGCPLKRPTQFCTCWRHCFDGPGCLADWKRDILRCTEKRKDGLVAAVVNRTAFSLRFDCCRDILDCGMQVQVASTEITPVCCCTCQIPQFELSVKMSQVHWHFRFDVFYVSEKYSGK